MADTVAVNGIGQLPASFAGRFTGFNLNIGDKIMNHHNESFVETSCTADTFVNDDFNMLGYKTRTGYHFEVDVNSEVNIPLWNDGRLIFDYNEASKSWSVKAFVAWGEWKFCAPKEAVNIVVSGLKCYAGSEAAEKSGLKTTAQLLADSLSSDLNAVTNGMALYTNETDCSHYVDNSDIWTDGMSFPAY
jgi:hypothetical protein